MMMIKKFSEFIKEEAISGTELIGSLGVASPDSTIPNTINYNDTKTILAIDNKFYVKDDFIDLLQNFRSDFPTEYQEYIKNGGTDEFKEFNINYILKQKKMLN
jgi:hypothetical protein